MARKPAKKPWPAYEVGARSLDELSPHAANARTHDEAQVEEIVRSIGQFGWTNPVLVDEAGTVIAGHGRRLAAQKIYAEGGTIRLPDGRELPKGTVPVIDCTGWSDAQKRAYMLADNQIALNAGWDMDLLRDQLNALNDVSFDTTVLAFGEEFLAGLFGTNGSAAQSGAGKLADKFGVPPFSVLNAREGWWQERKAAWLSLGIQSELGRGDTQVNSPHEGRGMADGLVAVRAKQKAGRKANAIPGGGSHAT